VGSGSGGSFRNGWIEAIGWLVRIFGVLMILLEIVTVSDGSLLKKSVSQLINWCCALFEKLFLMWFSKPGVSFGPSLHVDLWVCGGIRCGPDSVAYRLE